MTPQQEAEINRLTYRLQGCCDSILRSVLAEDEELQLAVDFLCTDSYIAQAAVLVNRDRETLNQLISKASVPDQVRLAARIKEKAEKHPRWKEVGVLGTRIKQIDGEGAWYMFFIQKKERIPVPEPTHLVLSMTDFEPDTHNLKLLRGMRIRWG